MSRECAFERSGYNWEEMEKERYQWWQQRLSHMAQYFTAYRVDHILAFFRIFQIPDKHVTGALGHFRPSRALARTGLENVGLWDIDRLCEPYITIHALQEELGDDTDEVIGKYLDVDSPGKFRFKPEYNCERALEAIPTPPNSPDWLQKVCIASC
jgi:4-alpha-glucanotransferase